ncbi:phosphotransferase [Mycoplasma sp. ES3157-GEN-MYC]|uniref:Phosphotransferase n=1 Tax=Mycoplasma miroungigenitalium TaxID=754515 RepID=A0A6M4JBD2_9MOLU|nr:phosphotransferase [Mycoplasma miroungigenitalium]MBU4690202.1 phosphotransferase [Mycoplasma miroungigenitalium]MBU4691471.1 phosphotransferase [Mycoplasma miroungigenitalium]QJR43306.1 phosphotransferase [Mycoplasma miroungigenitalium]
MKTEITTGHTNISYRIGDEFVQEKQFNGFNHKIDYHILSKFNFVPRLIQNKSDIIKWEFIEGQQPILDFSNIELIARQVKQIHDSKLKFPKSNHAARVKEYRKILKEKNRSVPVLEEYYRCVNLTLSKMDKTTPLHNDLWPFNMIQIEDKIFFVDWEYSTLGDKHFELAYIIEASNLTGDLEAKFLNAYGDYNYIHLLRHKILVNYLVVLWVQTQTKPPFNTEEYEKRIYNYGKELKKLTNS